MREIAAALALLISTALFSGCFSPQQPSCAFSCTSPTHACPSGYTCGSDGICHSDNNQGECALGGQDGGTGVDGTTPER
jgi:hypothetical protein